VSANFNEHEFKRSLEQEVKTIADEEVKKVGAEFERTMNGLNQSNKGKPVADVKRNLRSEFRRLEVPASEKELDDYAQTLADGGRIDVKYK
jgi:hypothetical protein